VDRGESPGFFLFFSTSAKTGRRRSYNTEADDGKRKVDTMQKTLTIMRGIPGSGKSTLAVVLANVPGVDAAPVYSTDDFFMIEGVYRFDPSKLGANHGANLARTVSAMEAEIPHVIVDNTMTQAWEAREYVRAAVRLGYAVQFIEPRTPWARDAAECARRNSHGVPEASIVAMLARWEDDLTVEKCLAAKAPWEK
jgi:predicted kinase